MLKNIFGSKTRIKILKLFVFNPQKEYYSREIERLTQGPFEPIRKELLRLESVGFLKSRISGKQKYYSINTSHTLYPEIKSMILKTVGLGDLLQTAVKEQSEISAAFIYGSYAKNTENTDSDIDLFVVGELSSKKLQGVISGIENETKREINHILYSREELKEKYKAKNHFITSVLKGQKLFLKGDENALRELVGGRQTL